MWKSITDTYEVSTTGDVRNKKTQRILKPYMRGEYHGVSLGGKDRRKIHQLVAHTFLPAPTAGGCVVDHIDRNKFNNSAVNLRWVSRRENNINRDIENAPRRNNRHGHHHIKILQQRYYVVRINSKKWGFHYKCCKTLNDAIEYRESIINAVQASQGAKEGLILGCEYGDRHEALQGTTAT